MSAGFSTFVATTRGVDLDAIVENLDVNGGSNPLPKGLMKEKLVFGTLEAEGSGCMVSARQVGFGVQAKRLEKGVDVRRRSGVVKQGVER